jgi:hypothetical protein
MAIFGRIAAAYLAALEAHTQVNPGVSDLQTLLTTPGMRFHLLHMIFCVGTLCCAHAILSIRVSLLLLLGLRGGFHLREHLIERGAIEQTAVDNHRMNLLCILDVDEWIRG